MNGISSEQIWRIYILIFYHYKDIVFSHICLNLQFKLDTVYRNVLVYR